MTPVVYLGMPIYDQRAHVLTARAFYHPTRGGCKVITQPTNGSLIPQNCNSLWADALNCRREKQISFFGMIHSDVIPQEMYFLDKMMQIMVSNPLIDILSAVVPIKNKKGITSTALEEKDHPWGPRRLTMTEIFERSETFTDPDLLVNTGLMLCRFDRPWCKAVDENNMLKVYFDQQDGIEVDLDGNCHACTFSEDWGFSRRAKAQGAKIYATRAVKLYHHDEEYTNSKVWGTWKTDKHVPVDGDAIGI